MVAGSFSRRTFLKQLSVAGGVAAVAPLAVVGPVDAAPDGGPYGFLQSANNLGLRLPVGFRARVVARSGQQVATTGFTWHNAPDGGACFPTGDGGWTYVSNAELSGGSGGASFVRFSAAGAVVGAGSVLSGTSRNCSGGATPWGTWLSCEETGNGRVWECDPTGATPAVVRPGLGRFNHEAAAVDPSGRAVYLTEDRSDGGLYRFLPTNAYDLSAGVLEVMTETNGTIGWARVPRPLAGEADPTRRQVSAMKVFNRGEGAFFADGVLYFATTGDSTVWTYRATTNTLDRIYARATSSQPALSGADNLTTTVAGDVFVCEDGGNMELVLVPPEGGANPFLRVIGQDDSELTGVAFNPAGDRLYVSSQRPGITYEITGPFRTSVGTPTFRCNLDGRILRWNNQNAGTYYIRAVDEAGNAGRYLGETSGLSFAVPGNDPGYLVRYWRQGPNDATCPGFVASVSGGLLRWNDQGANTYYLRALNADDSLGAYLGQTNGLSFPVSGNDPGYLVRHWVSGQGAVDAPTLGFTCSVSGGVLSWNDQGASTYYLRALDANGNLGAYLGQSNGLSFAVSGNDPGYLVRYWTPNGPVDARC